MGAAEARSTHGRGIVDHLLALPPRARDPILADLNADDLGVIAAVCRRELGSTYGLWQDDPEGFCTFVLGDSLWSRQRAILNALRGDDPYSGSVRLAVPSTHSSSKTKTASRAVAWWCSVWPIGTAKAITTAPRERQVKRLMWPQIRDAHRRGNLLGRVDQMQWIVPELGDPLAYGFTARNAGEDAVQGEHALHLLLVVDEAGGIDHTIGRAMEALTSQPHVRLLVIGNPPTDDEGSWFEERCSSPLWQVERISAADTPAYTGEVTPRCTGCPEEAPPHRVALHLTPPEWVREVVEEFGPESAFVTARVLALFPRGGARKTIPLMWLEEAAEAEHEAERGTWVRLGVDVAADGGDEFAIARAIGHTVRIVHRSSGATNQRPLDVAGDVLTAIREAEEVRQQLGEKRPVRVKIDSIGVGWGVAGILEGWGEEGKHPAEIVRVNVSESANEPDRFVNKRAELWWTGRKLFTPRAPSAEGDGPRLKLVGSQQELRKVVAQLNAPSYKTNSSGQTVVQPKLELRKAGLPSPDQAEAVLLSVYEPQPTEPAVSRSASDQRIPRPVSRQGSMTRIRPRR